MIQGIPSGRFLRELYQKTSEDNISDGAAVLGFYLTLAIFPALIFVMAVIPYLPIANVDRAIMDLLRQAMPPSAADMVAEVVDEVANNQRGGLVSFGALGTLWAASSGMNAIMQQLNLTYDVKEGRSVVKARAVALGLSLLFGAMVLAAFSLIVVGGLVQDWLGARYGVSALLLGFFAALRWAIIVATLLLGFALIYYFAPNVEQDFSFITPGAVLGVALLAVASLGFSFYVSRFGDYSAVYGGIGAVIVLMLWLYIAGLVILLGSEINALVEHYSAQGKRLGQKRAEPG